MAHGFPCALFIFIILLNNFPPCIFIEIPLDSDNCTATCKSGSCIYEDWICDHVEDCSDGSDEMNCGVMTCSAGHILCTKSNKCIPEMWGCDGENNCPDGEDEINCEDNSCENQFQCKDNNRCISMEWKCDFEPDCDDGSDEAECDGQICSEFQCQDGRCIQEEFRCDGDRDCYDGSDESNCTFSAANDERDDCEAGSFKCTKSGECIHKAWKCDGGVDCLDQSDEDVHTCSHYKCKDGQFSCADNRTCIPDFLRCDSIFDCLDESDELNCPEPSCTVDQFDCTGKGNSCISKDLLCNHHQDCPGGEDEDEEKCIELSCGEQRCSHTCVDWHGQSICTCPKGMQASEDNKTCKDINECLNPLTCSHICINKPEGRGHTCLCHPGYEIDWLTLRCKAAEEEPLLLFANQHDVREIGLRNGAYKSIVGQLHTAIAIDYDYRDGLIYWSDVSEETISRIPLRPSDNGTSPSKELVTANVSTPDGLALDWIHKNLYWTDTGKKRIEVASVRDLHLPWRTILFSDRLDEPRAIVADPRPGRWYLFWSDWGTNPKIERSSLDGSDRKVVVSTDILWPNGLTVDYEMDRIYWIDAKFYSIFSANYDGEDRRLILYSAFYIRHPFAMAFFEDEVYWSDWETEAIYKVPNYLDPRKARSEVKEVAHRLHLPMDVLIHHRLKQPIAEDVCRNSNCQQLCLPRRAQRSDGRNFSCACSSPDFKLASDGRRCIHQASKKNLSTTTIGQHIHRIGTGTTRPTDDARHFLLDEERHHKKTIGFIVCIFITAIIILFLIILLLYRSYKRKTPKILNFDNPVYRRTTDDTLVLQRNQKSILLSPPLLQPLNGPRQ